MPIFLKILLAPAEELRGVKVPLVEGANTIGRVSPPSSIKLDGTKVSKKHCSVKVSGEKVFLEDLQSSNGVYVNGKKVTSVDLKTGDRMVIGDFTLELVVG